MTNNEPAQGAGSGSSRGRPEGRVESQRGIVRPFWLWAAGAVALGVTVAGCSSGPTTPTAGSQTTTSVAAANGSGSSGTSPLSEAVAYSQCVRSHGVPNFPDPVQTPSGGYGYRTNGIDPNSAAFQGALQACKALPSPWNSTGQQLSAAQQQAWLNWAKCIRANGMPDFPDPTFSGSAVHDSGVAANSPLLQRAMNACKAQMPTVGGLGG
jgi:hypothetical protein